MDALEELATLLRPAGGGLYLVSTGRAEQLALQRQLYGVQSEAEVQTCFRRALERIVDAKVVLLGAPSDVGAGFLRSANLGPQAMRQALLEIPAWTENTAARGIVDIGDVFVVPQLLHDEMLSSEQLQSSRRALYPTVNEADAATLPVSPLSIAERALDLVFQLNPKVAPLVLGGDHSNAWPVAKALSKTRKDRWGIVQPDAHTDLMSERLGIKYCFATWSYHANELMGREGRMVQVGIRASRFQKDHWENTLGVRQFWADECLRDPFAAIDAIESHLKAKKIVSVYLSNDIDGTDESYGDATGTPEPNGLHPEFLVELIRRLGREFRVIAGDLMELAPSLGQRQHSKSQTVALAVRYVRETVDAMLAQA